MKYPRQRTACYEIAQTLYEHKLPVTIDEGIALHGYPTMAKRWAVRTIYDDMVKTGYLVRHEDKYSLAPYIRKHYDDITGKPSTVHVNLVQKRTNLSRGEMTVQKRDPRIREIYFKVGSV